MKARECGACGGSGWHAGHRHCTSYRPGEHTCPACQGSGRIAEPTEAEKRRDAMADAQALEWLADSMADSSDEAYGLWHLLQEAKDLPFVHDPWNDRIDPFEHAASARAAFRAVPALRGE